MRWRSRRSRRRRTASADSHALLPLAGGEEHDHPSISIFLPLAASRTASAPGPVWNAGAQRFTTSPPAAQAWQVSMTYGLRGGLSGSAGLGFGSVPDCARWPLLSSRALRLDTVWNAVVATGPRSSTM